MNLREEVMDALKDTSLDKDVQREREEMDSVRGAQSMWMATAKRCVLVRFARQLCLLLQMFLFASTCVCGLSA